MTITLSHKQSTSLPNDMGADFAETIECNEMKRVEASNALSDEAKSSKRNAIQRDRHTTINHPMMMEMHRRARLKMKNGEIEGTLKFVVPKKNLLHLPPSGAESERDSTASKKEVVVSAAAARKTLFRRIESIHPSRKEDDGSYFKAIANGSEVTLIIPLPHGYERGGWRCHALIPGMQPKTSSSANTSWEKEECLHPNESDNEHCMKCKYPKPKLKPEFLYLRLLQPGLREQRNEYLRIIKECDFELERWDSAEKEAQEV